MDRSTGETLRVGGSLLTVTVDPAVTGSPFAAGTQALPPKSSLTARRFLQSDTLYVAYHGQGRAVITDRRITLVPGVQVHVPKGTWHELHNTGTGELKLLWVSDPPGMERFYRAAAALGEAPSSEALEPLARQYGVEVRSGAVVSGGPALSPGGGRRHRRRRGRRSRGASQPSAGAGAPSPAVRSAVQTPAVPAAQPPAGLPSQPVRRRRRHRRGGRGRSAQTAAGPAATAPTVSPTTKPSSPPDTKPSAGRDRRPSRNRPRRGRVREVYMGGRWVQVSGEGPVISTE